MQNLKPTHFSAVADHPSAVGDVLDRVVTIATAPLLPGEKQADYSDVAVRIVRAANPRDAIEEFLIRDGIDLTWEILRLRRVKTGIVKASMSAGVYEILKGLGHGPRSGPFYARELGEKWAAGDKDARKEVEAALAKAGLTIDEVTARTLESKLDFSSGSTACSQAPRRAVTTPYARLIVTAPHSVPQCGKCSMKSKMRSFEMSKPANSADRPLDQRSPTARQSRQCEI